MSAEEWYERGEEYCRMYDYNLEYARSAWHKAATMGHVGAYYSVGQYEYKRGNHQEALKWYCQAAEANHTRAKSKVGRAYFLGLGVEKDVINGSKMFVKAAQEGYVPAVFCLARSSPRWKGSC